MWTGSVCIEHISRYSEMLYMMEHKFKQSTEVALALAAWLQLHYFILHNHCFFHQLCCYQLTSNVQIIFIKVYSASIIT